MQPEDLILPQEREHPLLFWANPVCTNGVASYKEAKIRFFFVMLTSPKSIIHFQYLKMEPFDLFFFFLTWDTVPSSDSRLRAVISWQRMEQISTLAISFFRQFVLHINDAILHSLCSCCIWSCAFIENVQSWGLSVLTWPREQGGTITRPQRRVDFSVLSEILCDFFFLLVITVHFIFLSADSYHNCSFVPSRKLSIFSYLFFWMGKGLLIFWNCFNPLVPLADLKLGYYWDGMWRGLASNPSDDFKCHSPPPQAFFLLPYWASRGFLKLGT